ncbi:MAG: hypothetical protein FWH57_06635 [Oscillospiraceae bacterium]|nr:hypothetical protein [Oscillospiraceae bacterium]
MKKYLFLIISAVVIVLMLIIVLIVSIGKNPLMDSDNTGIGKDLYIKVEEDQIADYSFLFEEPLSLWKKSEQKKMVEYMKENGLVFSEGEYLINQTTTFEEALEIFRFKSKMAEKVIGKDLYFVVEEGQNVNYTFLSSDPLTLWKKDEKEKMIEYMKVNNFVLIEGQYTINQTTTFEEALKIFKFTSNN